VNLESERKLMHQLNHGDGKSGVGKADHVNLRDGITFDVDGIPSRVGEDTKIPLNPFNPLDEPDVYEVALELPDVGDNQDTIDVWRRRDDDNGDAERH